MNDNNAISRSDAELAVIHSQTAAVTRLLLGSGRMGSGAIITGGNHLELETRIALGQAALSSDTDLVHLEFGYDADTRYGLTGIVLILPRDGAVHIQTGCQLYVGRPGSQALILPVQHVRGAFQLTRNELIHRPSKPADASAGIDRAARLIANALPAESASDARFQLLNVASR